MTSCTTWRRTIHWRRLQKGINTWHRWKRRKSQNIHQHNTRDKRYLRKEFQLFLLYQACYRCSSLLKWDWFFNLANQNIANNFFFHVFVGFSLKKGGNIFTEFWWRENYAMTMPDQKPVCTRVTTIYFRDVLLQLFQFG